MTNLAVTGLMVIAFAAGLHRVLTPGRSTDWAGGLVATYGLSLIVAGIFRVDPALGFPEGAPEVPASISWHAMVHFAAGGIGFTCLAIACFAAARRYGAEGRRRWAGSSRLTGVVFLAGFAMVASGGAARRPTLSSRPRWSWSGRG